ncbi:MAG: hypothetical protein IJN10_05260 [Firmicutes bacterium]|nr:hypothetical protein [Bacillota bacterium]
MKEKIKHWLTHNILLKVVALVLAILTWMAFYSGEDPIIPASFKVPVEVVHLEEFKSQGHYIAIEGEENLDDLTVEVFIQARTSVIEQLRVKDPTSFIYAYVDVYELEDGNVERLMIHYEDVNTAPRLKFDFYERKNTSYFDVDVDNSTTKEIEVRYEISGKPEEGYMYLADDEDIKITPEVITLTGPSNQLEKIEYGKVTIRIADASANVIKSGDIVLHEADGDVVRYSRDVIRASISEASVFVPIYMKKMVGVQPYLDGETPAGYEYGKDAAVSQPKVEIYGPESVINRINNIALPTVDLSAITENYQATIDLNQLLMEKYNGEVGIVNEEMSKVDLTFTVEEQQTRSYDISTSEVTVSGNRNDWSVNFAEDSFTLEVVGLEKNLDEFDPETIKLSVRLQEGDFVAGKHAVVVSVTELGDVKLKNDTLKLDMVFAKASEISSPADM